MNQGFLFIDGNNIGYANAANKALQVGDMEVQAIYGMLRQLRPIVARYPQLTPVVLWDGRSWRYDAYPEYKATREKDLTKELKPYEIKGQLMRESFKKQAPHIKRGLNLLGVRQCVAMNLEADDLIGIMVRRYQPQGKKIVMISGDTDWIQLVQPGVAWRDVQRDTLITYQNLPTKLGYAKEKKDADGIVTESTWVSVPSARAWLEVKAMCGDTTDNLPGVGGIGEKGAIELVNKFGSVAEFFNKANLEGLKLPKKLADFATDPVKLENYQRNLWLMDLAHPRIPAPVDLRLTGGTINYAGFEQFCQEFAFQSLLTDLISWVEPFAGPVKVAA